MISSSNSTLLKTSSSIASSHKVLMEWNYNSFIPLLNKGCYTTLDTTPNPDWYYTSYESNNASSYYDDGVNQQHFQLTSTTYTSKTDKVREKFTPVESMFSPNRPNPGIIHLTKFPKESSIISLEKIKAGNFGNIYENNVRTDRVYPMYANSNFRYWTSVRQKNISNTITTVGVSDSSQAITYAAPFAVYESSFYANKIVIKTQKYIGYPVTFRVEYLLDGGTTWTTAYSQSDSTELADGILEIYYNGTSWSTTPTEVSTFLSAPSNALKIRGVRFSVVKMSTTRVPLEVIEISPRLVANLTDYVISFDKTSSVNAPSFGIPVAGTISGTSTLKFSNVDRIFSPRNTTSILSNMLSMGVKAEYYQILGGTESIPLGTFYVNSWSENSDFSTSVELEDYFMFLKNMKAPDIAIGNISGIEASVALLILLDNCGITNFNFIKKSSTSQDDFIMDFFFCNKTQTVAEVIEQIAVSAQLSIFVNAYNVITAITKEKITETVSPANTDYWFVGAEDYASKTENAYISGNLANIQSITESKVLPLTDLNVRYAGNNISRSPRAVLKNAELLDEKNVPYYNTSIISRDLSYNVSELWSHNTAQNGSDKVLISMPYIQTISATRPSIINTEISGTGSGQNNSLVADSENDLIRLIYANSTAANKQYFEIVLDPERGTEFLYSNKFSGYVIIDSELIKYNGIVVDIFDPKALANTKRSQVVFNQAELSALVNKTNTGSSVIPTSLLVELNYTVVDRTTAISGNSKKFKFVSDGRAQENTAIAEHKNPTSTGYSNIFRTKLVDTTVSSSLNPVVSLTAKSINLLNPLKPETSSRSVSYPGYIKVSGPKGVFSKNSKTAYPISFTESVRDRMIPTDNFGERFITGVSKTLDFIPQKISTRVRLLSKPKTQLFTKYDKDVPNYSVENRGIAGLGFRLNPQANGTTGYFIEIEDIGNVTKEQLSKKIFENLRLYKVTLDGSNYYQSELMAQAWVNVSAVSQESVDFGQSMVNNGRSYGGTSDLSVVISESGLNYRYTVYWEGQLVCSAVEKKSIAINKDSRTIGMMVRSDSEAMFDYMLAQNVSDNGQFKVDSIFSNGSEFMSLSDAAERGFVPKSLTMSSTSTSPVLVDMEDFGRQLREAIKFDVKFENPALDGRMISLSRTNSDYAVNNFSFSSYGASFWVFNTSRNSISLGTDTNTPVIISGIEIGSISPGEISLKSYLDNISGDNYNILEKNKNKYGENSLAFEAAYLNNIDQARSLLAWIFENINTEKKEFSIDTFANPLLEIGDKVRLYYPAIEHEMSKIIDAIYYITSIRYGVDESGPSMSVTIREI